MPCSVRMFGTYSGTGDQPNANPGAHFRCAADIFSNITNREIQLPGMLIARKIGHVGLGGCTNFGHNRRSGRKLVLCITPLIAGDQPAVYWVICRVCVAHRVKIELRLKWEVCQQELCTFANIPVV